MAVPSMRAMQADGNWTAPIARNHESSLKEQSFGAGPFVLVVFAQVANVRTTHRCDSAEWRAYVREGAEQFGLVVEAEYEVK